MNKVRDVILSAMIAMGIVLLCWGGLVYLGSKAWERSWVKVESIEGPNGYTYCLMHETGIGQDPHTKLSRTKTPEDENSYKDIGIVNEASSWLTVIRPVAYARRIKTRLRITSNNMIFIACYDLGDHISFVYDIDPNQFYEEPENNKMSPFILIDGEDAELYESDVAWVISRVLQHYTSYVRQKEYISSLKKDGTLPTDYAIKDYVPEWPTQEALNDGLAHPNKEVQKIAGWLLHIQQNGLDDSETSREIRAFLDRYDDQ